MNLRVAKEKVDRLITQTAAQFAVTEMIAGTLLHSFKIPLAGHFLSLNQGLFLARAVRETDSRWHGAQASYEISGVAAMMKSLAPALKKLGPMLSIMMQGLLFSLGVLMGGRGRLGQWLGLTLLSLWAFVQPFVTLLVVFGPAAIQEVSQFYLQRLQKDYAVVGAALVTVVLVVLIGKLVMAGAIIWFVNRRENEGLLERWQEQMAEYSVEALSQSEARVSRRKVGLWRDLTRPFFLLSFALSVVFLLVTKESRAEIVWLSLRPLGVYLLLLWLWRSEWFRGRLGRIAARVGFLRPIEQRWHQVQNHLNADQGCRPESRQAAETMETRL